MGIYYNEVEEAIKNNEREIRHLHEELKGLRSVEKDTPRASYQRQEAQIRRHMATEESRLEGNRNLLNNYKLAQYSLQKLEELRRLRGKERDQQIRREIDEEIAARERELESSMGGLTDELRQELRDEIDNLAAKTENTELDEMIEKPEAEVEKAKEKVKKVEEETPTNKSDEMIDELNYRTHYENGMEYHEDDTTTDEESDDDTTTSEEEKDDEAAIDSPTVDNTELTEIVENPETEIETGKEKVKKVGEVDDIEESTTDEGSDDDATTSEEEKDDEAVIDSPTVADTPTEADAVTTDEESDDDTTTSEEEKDDEAVIDSPTVTDASTESDDTKTDEGSDNATTTSEEEKDEKTDIQTLGESLNETDESSKDTESVVDEMTATEEDMDKRRARVSAEYELAEEAYQAAIRRMQEIFREEKEEKERIGVISTEKELDAFYDDYLQQKIKQNEIIEAAKKRRDFAQTSLRIIDTITAQPNKNLALPPHTSNKELPPHIVELAVPQKEEYEVAMGKNIPQPVYAPPKVQEIQVTLTNEPEEYEVAMGKNIPQPVYAPPKVQEIQVTLTNEPEEYEVAIGENIPQPVYAPPKVQEIQGPFTNSPEEYEVPIGENIPQPVYAPPNAPELIEAFEQLPPKKGLMTIFDELTHGLILKPKDGKRYKASNIRVAKDFRDELNSGNYLYNLVHLVPAIIKLPIQLLRKVSGKLMFSANAQRNAKTLERRLNNLSTEELMTIYEEYRGNRVLQERYPTIMNTLIDERMQRFALENITRINDELEERYSMSFDAISKLEEIDSALSDPEITDERRSELQSHRAEVLEGQASNIEAIRAGYVEANSWLSGGINGFSEDIKATTAKLSVVGRIFGKDHKLDTKLLHQQALLEQKENEAIAAGDDEAALRAFVESEMLLNDNTEISEGLLGRRSVGKKHYSPLVEQLDDRDAHLEGNSVTDMVNEYAETQQAVVENERKSRI